MLSENARNTIQALLPHYQTKQSAVIPALYLAQKDYGYLTDAAVREVAEILDMDPTEVLGVSSFYTLLYDHPVGKYVLQICDDLPCALRGAEEFADHVCRKLGVKSGQTTPDGMFTVERVMCLGACNKAPLMQVNLEFHENLTTEQADRLIEDLRSGKVTTPGKSAIDLLLNNQ